MAAANKTEFTFVGLVDSSVDGVYHKAADYRRVPNYQGQDTVYALWFCDVTLKWTISVAPGTGCEPTDKFWRKLLGGITGTYTPHGGAMGTVAVTDTSPAAFNFGDDPLFDQQEFPNPDTDGDDGTNIRLPATLPERSPAMTRLANLFSEIMSNFENNITQQDRDDYEDQRIAGNWGGRFAPGSGNTLHRWIIQRYLPAAYAGAPWRPSDFTPESPYWYDAVETTYDGDTDLLTLNMYYSETPWSPGEAAISWWQIPPGEYDAGNYYNSNGILFQSGDWQPTGTPYQISTTPLWEPGDTGFHETFLMLSLGITNGWEFPPHETP